jgi:OPT family oligopeptide transporter
MAEKEIGQASLVGNPTQLSQEEEQGYKPIYDDDANTNTDEKHLRAENDEDTKIEDDEDPPVIEYDPTEYDRYQEHNELTFRAIIVGCLIGVLVAAMNVNFGLRTGWTQGGSVFASIIAIGVFKILNPVIPFSRFETCLAVTAASSAGTMTSTAGLVSSIPALKLLGHTYSVWELFAWAIAVAYFGVYFAVPMRKQMLVIEKLRFPSGTATAMTIKAMFARGSETVEKAKMLLYWGVGTALWALLVFFIPLLEEPPMPNVLHQWGFTIYLDPLLMGGGMLSGPRATGSMLLGSIVGWGILGPAVRANGWATGPVLSYTGVRGWILWVGVAIMTTDSVVQLLFTTKIVFEALINLVKRIANYRSGTTLEREETKIQTNIVKEEELQKHLIPWYWPIIGLIISTVMLTLIGHFVFELKYYFVWAAIPLGALLSIIATRCAGETDINPVGGMGKVTQLVFAGLAPKQVTTNLLSAGVVAAGASQCGDMMQDLKTGYILRVAPKKQFIAQSFGIICGILFCVPIYKLYDAAYHIGGEQLPAPAAHAWKSVAEILAKGFNALPINSGWGILGGALFGFITPLLNKIVALIGGENAAGWVPSALAFGIGFIVPPKQSISMFAGSMLYLVWKRGWPQQASKYFFAVSSGMIAGEGIMGIFVAMLKLLQVKPLVDPYKYN